MRARNLQSENAKIGRNGFDRVMEWYPTVGQFDTTEIAFGKGIKTMKAFKPRNLTLAVCLLMAPALQSSAIVGLGIAKDGTNIVISWPSLGYEHYLIQYRSTLDSSTPW